MALVDVTATGEDNILNTEQLQELISDDLKYRNRQLKKLKEEVLGCSASFFPVSPVIGSNHSG